MATILALTTAFTPASYCYGSSIFGGSGTMTLGNPSNIPACYPSGHSIFSPGILCPDGWHASSTSTISSTSYLAICCPSAILASSIGVVWLPSTQGCSANLSQASYSLVTNGLVIQPGSTYSYQRLTMGHLEANPILLHWKEKDLPGARQTPSGVTLSPSPYSGSNIISSAPNSGSKIVSSTRTTARTLPTQGAIHAGAFSSAQKTIIATSVPVIACISAVAATWLILRYRKARRYTRRESSAGRDLSRIAEPETSQMEIEVSQVQSELPVEQRRMPELDTSASAIAELDVSTRATRQPGDRNKRKI